MYPKDQDFQFDIAKGFDTRVQGAARQEWLSRPWADSTVEEFLSKPGTREELGVRLSGFECDTGLYMDHRFVSPVEEEV